MTYKQTNIKKYALRKLAIGVASCAIGCAVVNVGSLKVYANTSAVATTTGSAYDISNIVSQLTDNRSGKYELSKSEASFEGAVTEIRKEATSPNNKLISIHMLGDEKALYSYISLEKLETDFKKEFQEKGYAFAKIGGHYLSNGSLYVMKNTGVVVNNLQQYQDVIKDMFVKNDGKARDVYSSFELRHSFIELLLQANGLGLSGARQSVIIDGVETHAQSLRLGTSAEYLNKREFTPLGKTLDDYTKNDEKILELIKESGALKYENDSDRVRVWAEFVTKKFQYDSVAYASIDGADYNRASTVYSVFENNNKAICVGFSSLSARAYNLMGIRSYVVYGKLAGGGAHAVTRTYFNNRWNFVDTTATGSSRYSLNDYSEADQNALNGEMKTHREFEKWMENQNPRHLLLLNTDKALFTNKRLEYYISEDEKQQLLSLQQLLKERYSYIVSTLENSPQKNENLLKNIKGFVDEIDQEMKQLKSYDKMIGSMADEYFATIDNFNSTAGSIERECSIPIFQNTSKIDETLKKLVEQKNAYGNHEVEQDESKKRSRRSLPSGLEESTRNKEMEEAEHSGSPQETPSLQEVELISSQKVATEEKVVVEESTPISEEAVQENIVSDSSRQQESLEKTEGSSEVNVSEHVLTTTLDVITDIVSTVWESLSQWIFE